MKKILDKFYTPWNLLILIILLLAFILRIYRIGELLGFHYDQGRDALIIWDLIKNHKLLKEMANKTKINSRQYDIKKIGRLFLNECGMLLKN